MPAGTATQALFTFQSTCRAAAKGLYEDVLPELKDSGTHVREVLWKVVLRGPGMPEAVEIRDVSEAAIVARIGKEVAKAYRQRDTRQTMEYVVKNAGDALSEGARESLRNQLLNAGTRDEFDSLAARAKSWATSHAAAA